ncbi:hypothetical protein ES332_A01G145600v1 [Gossypium tomentosum]|uniref:Uncharacterized protein n=1 Tax=Gossypium tomentosum TaxID=34277 RepID=A0A5D2RQN4_GOSTO|nr:hypothetical protein ES332_A01G145600v1 [Gossypium tomentosum]
MKERTPFSPFEAVPTTEQGFRHRHFKVQVYGGSTKESLSISVQGSSGGGCAEGAHGGGYSTTLEQIGTLGFFENFKCLGPIGPCGVGLVFGLKFFCKWTFVDWVSCYYFILFCV